MSKPETWTVEILHKDSHCCYKYSNVISVHEEGSYTVLYKEDEVIKFPTIWVWRLKCRREDS
jgi:hypothetical protein